MAQAAPAQMAITGRSGASVERGGLQPDPSGQPAQPAGGTGVKGERRGITAGPAIQNRFDTGDQLRSSRERRLDAGAHGRWAEHRPAGRDVEAFSVSSKNEILALPGGAWFAQPVVCLSVP